MRFAVGTMVQLISGGPRMMVTSLRDQGDGVIHCEWFNGGLLKRDAFDAANLRALEVTND